MMLRPQSKLSEEWPFDSARRAPREATNPSSVARLDKHSQVHTDLNLSSKKCSLHPSAPLCLPLCGLSSLAASSAPWRQHPSAYSAQQT